MPSTPTTPPDVNANSYATIAEATTYLDDSTRAAAWEFLDDDTRARALLTATRLLDKQCWVGAQTSDTQPLSWPRTGVSNKEGVAIPDTDVPEGIIDGCIELAYELTQDDGLENSANTGSNTKRLKAGSAELENFRPGGVLGESSITRFPTPVHEYIRPFLDVAAGTAEAFGSEEVSSFDDVDRENKTDGYA